MAAKDFVQNLITNDFNFFVGVPDSLLKNFIQEINDINFPKTHLTASNEGSALAIAAGYHIGTSKTPVVYLQNSGLGNLINPITSLIHKTVYNIPVLFIIGWRGSDQNDEPQHNFQGKITQKLMETLEIPFSVLDDELNIPNTIIKAKQYITSNNNSFAILVKKGVLDSSTETSENLLNNFLSRSEVIEKFLLNFNGNAIFTSTTGKTSRELDTLIKKHSISAPYFLNVGSMGHVSAVSLGLDLSIKNESKFKIICFDGDGSALMHLGNFTTIAKYGSKNFIHLLLNNKVHESVGNQPISNPDIDFEALSKVIGYKNIFHIKSDLELNEVISKIKFIDGPTFIQIQISNSSIMQLARPTKTPVELKIELMQKIQHE